RCARIAATSSGRFSPGTAASCAGPAQADRAPHNAPHASNTVPATSNLPVLILILPLLFSRVIAASQQSRLPSATHGRLDPFHIRIQHRSFYQNFRLSERLRAQLTSTPARLPLSSPPRLALTLLDFAELAFRDCPASPKGPKSHLNVDEFLGGHIEPMIRSTCLGRTSS